MRASHSLVFAATLFALPLAVADARRPPRLTASCPDDVAAAIEAQCPCDQARTHGDYVSCVVRHRNALRKAGCLRDGGRWIVPCAARSTCGRPSAVVCCVPCDTDDACTTMRARIARTAASCVAAGGTSMGPGTMCGGACSATSTTTSTSTTTTTTTLAPGFDFGNDVEFPEASAHSPDYLLGGDVVLPRTAMLTHLGVIAKSAGPNVVLALYADAGGAPGQLVAATGATPMSVGRMEIPVAPTLLPAGVYWMMGVYDSDASIGIDETDPDVPVRYAWQPFASPLPNPFGPANEYTGQRFNYYIKVQ